MYGQAGRKQMYGREVKLVRVSTFDSRMRERDTGSRNPGAYILRRQCLVFFLVFMTMAALSLAVACIFKEDIFGSRESVVVMGEESLSAAAPQAEFFTVSANDIVVSEEETAPPVIVIDPGHGGSNLRQ